MIFSPHAGMPEVAQAFLFCYELREVLLFRKAYTDKPAGLLESQSWKLRGVAFQKLEKFLRKLNRLVY